MNKFFNDIMIPVFSTEELDTSADKAIEIAKHLQCNMHMLYMNRSHKISIFKRARVLLSTRKRTRPLSDSTFLDLHKKRLMNLHPSLSFHSSLPNESPQYAIVNYCSRHQIDLVLFLESRKSWWEEKREKFNIGQLSEKLNCPVLDIKLNTNLLNIKNIVIPIGSFLPMKRLIAGCYFGRLYNSKIHLVALNKKFLRNGRDEAVCLYKAYHLLHDNTSLPIECITLMSTDIDKATLKYAEQINADLVFVNSDKQSLYSETMN